MKTKKFSYRVLIIVVIVAAFGIYYSYKSSGICTTTLKRLSDWDLIVSVLHHHKSKNEIEIESNLSLSKWYLTHSDCCYVFSKKEFSNLNGMFAGERKVYIDYPLSKEAILNGKGGGGNYYEEEVEVSACGDIEHISTIGGHTKML